MEDMRLSMSYVIYGFPVRGIPRQFVTKLCGIAELMGRESIKLVFSFGFFVYILLEIGVMHHWNGGCARGIIQFQDYLPAIEDDAILKFLVLIIKINHNYIT